MIKHPQATVDSGEDNAENRLKKTFFIVEATSYEQFVLWKDWCAQSDSPRYGKLKWEQVNPGWAVTVGKIGKRPCLISLSWNRIEGRLVMFWYQCSQVTDSLQTESWLEEHFNGKYDNGTRRAAVDAQNFAHCIKAIREANRIQNNDSEPCEWVSGQKQCGKKSESFIKYPAWSKAIPMCKPHAEAAEAWCPKILTRQTIISSSK